MDRKFFVPELGDYVCKEKMLDLENRFIAERDMEERLKIMWEYADLLGEYIRALEDFFGAFSQIRKAETELVGEIREKTDRLAADTRNRRKGKGKWAVT